MPITTTTSNVLWVENDSSVPSLSELNDFHTSDSYNVVIETAVEESSYAVLSNASNLISNAKTTSAALLVENDSSVPLPLVVMFQNLTTLTPVIHG